MAAVGRRVTGRWIDLSQPFDGDAPYVPHPPPEFEELHAFDGDGVNVQWYGPTPHVGTHVDASRHFVPGGETIDGLSPDRFAGGAVVLDVARDDPGPVTPRRSPRPTARSGGDVVVVRTGWGQRYGGDGYERYPWLTADAADWLLDRDHKLLGIDTRWPDRPRAMRPEAGTSIRSTANRYPRAS